MEVGAQKGNHSGRCSPQMAAIAGVRRTVVYRLQQNARNNPINDAIRARSEVAKHVAHLSRPAVRFMMVCEERGVMQSCIVVIVIACGVRVTVFGVLTFPYALQSHLNFDPMHIQQNHAVELY